MRQSKVLDSNPPYESIKYWGLANLSPDAGLNLPLHYKQGIPHFFPEIRTKRRLQIGILIFSLAVMPVILESCGAHAFTGWIRFDGFNSQGSNIVLLVLRVGATHGSVGATVLSTPGE
ncbi:MAG: hypothetical protein R3B95_05265 [Nitrospirales bacterium]|nr:hypothetical protein [Nitrospirales bacterium]